MSHVAGPHPAQLHVARPSYSYCCYPEPSRKEGKGPARPYGTTLWRGVAWRSGGCSTHVTSVHYLRLLAAPVAPARHQSWHQTGAGRGVAQRGAVWRGAVLLASPVFCPIIINPGRNLDKSFGRAGVAVLLHASRGRAGRAVGGQRRGRGRQSVLADTASCVPPSLWSCWSLWSLWELLERGAGPPRRVLR